MIRRIIYDDGYYESDKMLNQLVQDYGMHVTIEEIVSFMEVHNWVYRETVHKPTELLKRHGL